jgi:hypothetical protein
VEMTTPRLHCDLVLDTVYFAMLIRNDTLAARKADGRWAPINYGVFIVELGCRPGLRICDSEMAVGGIDNGLRFKG